MNFSGTYRLKTQENFERFMKAIGLSDEAIEKGKDLNSETKIEQTENYFVVTVTTGPKVLCNKFTIGKETEFESLTGEKIKTTVNLVDGKLDVILKGVHSVTELIDDCIINTMTLGDIIYTRKSERVSEKDS